MNKKISILIPLAGLGQRFIDEGFKIPKPMIHITNNESIIEHSLNSINYKDCDLIFLVRREHITNFQINEFLIKKFGNEIRIIPVDYQTGGSTETALLALEYIDNEKPLVIWCSDVKFEMNLGKQFDPYRDIPNGLDSFLLCFKSNSPNYSYCELGHDNLIKRVVEKQVISEYANVGLYAFSKGSNFVKYAKEMIQKKDTTKGDYYLAPLCNYFVRDGLKVGMTEIENVWLFGTPSEYNFYRNCTLNVFGEGIIGISCDHSGYELSQKLVSILKKYELPFIDFGTHSNKSCDYVDTSSLLINSIKEKECSHGFLICRTGAGQSMFANRFNHIRSVLIHDEFTTAMAVKHNCANVFSIPSKYVNEEMLETMIQILLTTKFSGGRHEVRVRKIMELKNV